MNLGVAAGVRCALRMVAAYLSKKRFRWQDGKWCEAQSGGVAGPSKGLWRPHLG